MGDKMGVKEGVMRFAQDDRLFIEHWLRLNCSRSAIQVNLIALAQSQF